MELTPERLDILADDATVTIEGQATARRICLPVRCDEILALVAAARENAALRARLVRVEDAARRVIRECDLGIEEQMATALTRLEAALEETNG